MLSQPKCQGPSTGLLLESCCHLRGSHTRGTQETGYTSRRPHTWLLGSLWLEPGHPPPAWCDDNLISTDLVMNEAESSKQAVIEEKLYHLRTKVT